MPYIIPSSAVTPGTVYQPGKGVPAYITANARAMACIKGGALSSTHMLDQSPLNNGTRRTGEEGRCYTADGTDDEVNYGDIGSAIWFSGWVKLNSDDQCLFSLSNDTNTNIIVSSGVLTAGATLTLSAIKVDNLTKTASEAGALLNDNLWHFLSCGIGDGLGGASTADDVRYFTDGTNHGSVSGFDWRFWATAPTADELTEAYSGETTNRNLASLSKYALWSKMDEQSGTTSYDSSGNDLTGTITNATLVTFHATQDIWSFQNNVGYNLSGSVYIPRDESDPTNDVLGNPLTYTGRRPNDFKLTGSNCVDLNGTDQAVRVLDNSDFDLSNNITVSIWAKNNNSNLTTNNYIFSKYTTDGNNREWGVLIEPTLDNFSVNFGNPSNGNFLGRIACDTIPVLTDLNHYVFTFASGVVKMFLNGVERSTTLASGSIPSTLFNGSSDIGIGCIFSSSAPSSVWDGQTLDARIYSRVLSASEIQSIYEDSRNLIDDPNLVGRWKSQEGAGAVVYDSSGNDNHGTIENAASNWGVNQDLVHSNLLEGHGKRMYFDGVAGYVSVSGMSASNSYFGACTISAQIYVNDPNTLQIVWALGQASYRLIKNTASGTNWGVNRTDTGVAVSVGYQKVSVTYNSGGNAVSFKINDVEVWSGLASGADPTDTFYIGARDLIGTGVGAFFNGSIYNFSITGSPVKNLSLNGYGNQDADWLDKTGTVDDSDISVNGSPSNLYLPAKTSSVDIFDQPLTHPAGDYHNNAETTVDFNPDSTPEMGATQLGITVPSAHAFGDAFTASDQIFSRQRSKTEDRFLVFPEAQTGSALTNIQKYTQP